MWRALPAPAPFLASRQTGFSGRVGGCSPSASLSHEHSVCLGRLGQRSGFTFLGFQLRAETALTKHGQTLRWLGQAASSFQQS